ncbi:pilus assembly PilX N-terminal domain-containing protein [Marinobacterium rhizophilum]|uniref:Pilus assembly PilX N-terminal domain-containing protein n=1 Tax=Marinobacterium rhizophilum TaxID=420402 RepID=A0ABY5HGM3_9GAMM|nr:pilus assembly PilX N-terminal domain-containing protein [Marinobacterium rhizophilum]UTW11114.1 pilus assembly PilX N-terminal domain-containing protein [Marinobacterium rhizophilum]
MKGRQTGAATLFVTVIILALLTVIAAVSAKIGMFELKTSSNTNRAKEALHAGQGGLDYGAIRYLDDASWAGESLEMPFGGPGASVSVSAVTGTDSVVLNAVGESVDTTGLARVEEKFARVPVIDVGELPPLMANGNFPPTGSLSIVTNPNGGGTGVPVSGWVEDGTKTGTASWQTCNVDEWLYEDQNAAKVKSAQSDGFVLCHTCKCSQAINPICKAQDVTDADECPDIVVNTAGIPDVFQNLFGALPTDTDANGTDDWEEFMNAVAKVKLSNCAGLGPNSGDQFYSGGVATQLPLIWVEGDCTIPANTEVGSYAAPFILFVHGDLTISANSVFYGIAFGFSDKYSNPPAAEANALEIRGGAIVYGVVLTTDTVTSPTGNYTLVYSEKLLEKITGVDDTFDELARYPGSWTDTK